jgi:hypothetical protein
MKFQWNRDFPEELKKLFVDTLRSDLQSKRVPLYNVIGFLSALVQLECPVLEFPSKESEKRLQSAFTIEVIHQLGYYLENKDYLKNSSPYKAHQSNDRTHEMSDLIYLTGISGLLNPSTASFTEAVIVPSSSSSSSDKNHHHSEENSWSELNSLVLHTTEELFPVVDENDFKSIMKG